MGTLVVRRMRCPMQKSPCLPMQQVPVALGMSWVWNGVVSSGLRVAAEKPLLQYNIFGTFFHSGGDQALV